jgi:hypothetical protein
VPPGTKAANTTVRSATLCEKALTVLAIFARLTIPILSTKRSENHSPKNGVEEAGYLAKIC